MKGLRIIILLALLKAGLAKAGDEGHTSHVATQVRNLLDSAGYSLAQKTASLPRQDIHSHRNLHFIMRGPFVPLEVPVKRIGWSLWTNSSFHHVGRYADQSSLFAPQATLAQYEYDISYSFYF